MSDLDEAKPMTITVIPDDGGKVTAAMVDAVALIKKGYSLSTVNKKLRRLQRPATAFYGAPGET